MAGLLTGRSLKLASNFLLTKSLKFMCFCYTILLYHYLRICEFVFDMTLYLNSTVNKHTIQYNKGETKLRNTQTIH